MRSFFASIIHPQIPIKQNLPKWKLIFAPLAVLYNQTFGGDAAAHLRPFNDPNGLLWCPAEFGEDQQAPRPPAQTDRGQAAAGQRSAGRG